MILHSRFAVVASTAGSVMKCALDWDIDFRECLKLVVTDRPCGAENVAARFGIKCIRLDGFNNLEFSDHLLEALIDSNIDIAFVFFKRMLKGRILDQFSGKLVNFHPSLLPSFPGLNGFDDGWNSTSLLLGSTVHFVDAGVDTGPIIQQTFLPVNRSVNIKSVVRHKIFLQQCASLLQVSDWFSSGRICFNNNSLVVVKDAKYEHLGSFVPALEQKNALNLAAASCS